MKYTLLFLLLLFTYSASAIDIEDGVPFVRNYAEGDYYVSDNNFKIVQDGRGLLYFANEFGILEFDGQSWEIIQVATNRSNIKSLAFNSNNRLFIGAQGDFGYIDCDSASSVIFHSLVDHIPLEHRDFNDVWNIVINDEQTIFQSWKALYIYENGRIRVIKTGRRINRLFKVYDQIVMQDQQGLFILNNDQFKPLLSLQDLGEVDVRFILPINKSDYLIGTYEKGLFIWDKKQLKPFLTDKDFNFNESYISSGHLRMDGDYVIGTIHSGVVLIDQSGRFKMNLSKENGLQNNEIREVFSDRDNNLWVTNKTGIDFVELSTPLRHIKLDPDEPIGVYSAAEYHNNIVFATHNGLKVKHHQHMGALNGLNSHFTSMISPSEINWSVSRVNDNLIVGHSKGFTQHVGDEANNLYTSDGGWIVKQLINQPEYWIGGTYTGLILFKEINGQLVFQNKIQGFDESSRVIALDQEDNIWIAHGYKGIYRIKLAKDLSKVKDISFYDVDKGLPSSIYNNVFKVWDEVVFGTQQGIFKYDKLNDRMIQHEQLTELLGQRHCRMLKEDPRGNLWFVVDTQSGIITRYNNGSFSLNTNPFNKLNNLFIPGFENFQFLENEITLIGIKDGAVIYDAKAQTGKSATINALLRTVLATTRQRIIYRDNVDYLCGKENTEVSELPFVDNDLIFTFSAAFFENIEDIQFKFFLQGFDADWSEWRDVQYKEYTNLREGEYVFRLKALNVYGMESDELTYRFIILPPWYRTTYAYVGYLLIIALVFYIVLAIRNKRVKTEKKRYIEKQERIRKIERANFIEEKLKDELEIKNKELSAAATKVIYKNEKLNELKEKLVVIMAYASDKVEKKLKTLLAFIESEIEDDDWEDFELRFDQAHNNFIKNLKEEFPDLTPKDLKICAYLKMNMSSKEIAHLLNLSVRGVENARYRVRKRMGLESSVNITEWLLMRK